MTKHTPGPWRVCDQDSDNIHIGTKPMNHKIPWEYTTICNLYDDVTPEDSVTFGPWLRQHENAKANARLISKAPELLAMLERVCDSLEDRMDRDDNCSSLTDARALINSIKGE